jgi:hypothetical protein
MVKMSKTRLMKKVVCFLILEPDLIARANCPIILEGDD